MKFNTQAINAEVHEYDQSNIDDKRTAEKVLLSSINVLPLNWKGIDYKGIYMPCIPSIRFIEKSNKSNGDKTSKKKG